MKRFLHAITLFAASSGLLLPAFVRAQETLFPERLYATGFYPQSVAIADVNSDGKLDIITANSVNTVSVLLGQGNGKFAAWVTYTVGDGSQSVAVADVNGDGKPDIVTANSGNTVSVLLGNGDGTFAAHADYTISTTPGSVLIADINGDGKPDIITANSGSNTVGILLGNGDGTFVNVKAYAAGSVPVSAAVADVNGDGKPDIVTANKGTTTVSVLLGNGDGTFAIKKDYTVAANPQSVAVADVNGDGKPDIITANSGNTTSVLLGNGDGTFAAHTDYIVGSGPASVAVADVNGDGKPDIITGNSSSVSATISVLLGNGDGTFAAHTDYAISATPYSMAVADINGDGRLDIVTANFVGNNSISILFGNGDGTFVARTDYTVGSAPYSVAVADLNGDDKPDIITVNDGSNTVSILLGQGGGQFAAWVNYKVGVSPYSVAIADLNGDGKLDIITANYGASGNGTTVSVLLGYGDGTFAAKTDYTVGSAPYSVAVADVNEDGKPDIITANSGNSTVSVLLGQGNGKFAVHADYTVGSAPYSVAVADLNGDGKPDIVTANYGASGNGTTVSVLLGYGDGKFATKRDYIVGSRPNSVAIADVNGDSKPDIVTANYGAFNSHSGTYSDPTVSVLLGNGDGTFAAHTDYAVGSHPQSVAVADLNGDGKPDIVTSNTNYNSSYSSGFDSVNVLLNHGDGTFAAYTASYGSGSRPNAIAVADLNGDGKPDIITANRGRYGDVRTVSVLLNVAERSSVSGLLTLEGIAAGAPAQPVQFTFRSPGYDDFAPTLSVAPSGNFAINLPKRSGSLHIKGSKYLAANVNVDTTGGDVSGVIATLHTGDANNDNLVNIGDFGLLVNAFGGTSSDSTSGYDPNADFNGDGRVDIGDFGLLVNNYGSQGDL